MINEYNYDLVKKEFPTLYESVDFNIDYENVDEDTETGLNGRLAMLFLEFCNSLNNEGED